MTDHPDDIISQKGEILFYQAEDGTTRLQQYKRLVFNPQITQMGADEKSIENNLRESEKSVDNKECPR